MPESSQLFSLPQQEMHPNHHRHHRRQILRVSQSRHQDLRMSEHGPNVTRGRSRNLRVEDDRLNPGEGQRSK